VIIVSSVLAVVGVGECASIAFLACAPYRVTPFVASIIRLCNVVVLASIPVSCSIVIASLYGARSFFQASTPRARKIILIVAAVLACLGLFWLVFIAPTPHSIRRS
jgi:uncharacterized membrane protein